uniref:Ig-like domain-containing protein n=1 Tax=Oryzias latipes TaxID=8090 RepID=A0A3P9JYR5_ORYLA
MLALVSFNSNFFNHLYKSSSYRTITPNFLCVAPLVQSLASLKPLVSNCKDLQSFSHVTMSKFNFLAPRHMFHFIYGCYETDEVRVDLVVDDDTIGYADFTKQEMVWCLPYVPPSGKDLEKEAKKADHGTPLRQGTEHYILGEPPDLSIYTRYKAEEGVLDTLFCSANHFYPPTINFTWTKNGVEVTEGLLNLRFSHNKDGTFRGISTLSFTPQRGDVYSCWVSHEALERPRIITWGEAAFYTATNEKRCNSLSNGDLILCLAGIGTGLYFFIKKPNYCCGCQ